MTIEPAQQQVLLELARQTIRRALGDGNAEPPSIADPALQGLAGCFVSLHELNTHSLRGCIGRITADAPLEQAVREMAAGVLKDPRFVDEGVTLADLPKMQMEISVLSPMELASHPLDFEPLEHGIYLRIGRRSGCFLPQVARETGWSKEQLLVRLCTEKMGLPPNAWQSGAQLSRFTCQIIGPVPFVE